MSRRSIQWDQVFAFSKDQVRASFAEVVIKDKTTLGDEFIGKLPNFDLNQTPKFNPQNHLAPQWYRLAWHSDAALIAGEYLLPKLWYVRVNVIEAQALVLSVSHQCPKLQVLAVLGNQTFRATSIEDIGGLGRHEILGRCTISLQQQEKRLDHRPLNEHHRWEVFDPFTVITIAVFDDYHFHGYGGANDSSMGKGWRRQGNRTGGKVHLYIMDKHVATLFKTSAPFFFHYIHPLNVQQLDTLRDIATEIISNRLGKAEPPLKKEIVDYMLDVDLNIWSLRKSKANFLKSHEFSEMALPSIIFFSLFLIDIWNYRWRRAWHPPHMDSHLSLDDIDDPDDLDEEFDTFPTSQPSYTVKIRYDCLRSKGSRIQAELEKWATLSERFQSLITWADPRATPIYLLFCICTSVLVYFIEFRIIAAILGFYLLRHPWLRIIKFPKALVNFFTRLSSKADYMF
uniref:Multiple C2 domain-containing protein n=1 Tax=Chenopodium quinoa TaxID=63459 RepID=A0A803M2I6_CHEQI